MGKDLGPPKSQQKRANTRISVPSPQTHTDMIKLFIERTQFDIEKVGHQRTSFHIADLWNTQDTILNTFSHYNGKKL